MLRFRRGMLRTVVVVMTMATVLAAAACAGTDVVSVPGGNVGAATGTISGTPVARALRAEMLRVDEMRAIVSFGYDTRDQPVLDPKQFVLTTLRGPCGATVVTPFRADGGFKVFRSTVTLVIESVAEPGTTEAETFVDALQADARPGCPAFEEQVGGAPSQVETKVMLDLPELGDQRIAWEQTVTDASGKVGYRYLVAIRGAGRVLLLAVLATTAVPVEAISELADKAAKPT